MIKHGSTKLTPVEEVVITVRHRVSVYEMREVVGVLVVPDHCHIWYICGHWLHLTAELVTEFAIILSIIAKWGGCLLLKRQYSICVVHLSKCDWIIYFQSLEIKILFKDNEVRYIEINVGNKFIRINHQRKQGVARLRTAVFECEATLCARSTDSLNAEMISTRCGIKVFSSSECLLVCLIFPLSSDSTVLLAGMFSKSINNNFPSIFHPSIFVISGSMQWHRELLHS